MDETSSLKRSSTLALDDPDDDESCTSKKAKIIKEFPLNRQGSSCESQYLVMSQNDEVVDQSTLEYSVKDFLSDDDQATDEDDGKDDVDDNKNDAENDKIDETADKTPETEENSDKTDTDWDSEIKGDGSSYITNNDISPNGDSGLSSKTDSIYDHNTQNASDAQVLQTDGVKPGFNGHDQVDHAPDSKTLQNDEAKPGLKKIESVYRDAKLIKTIVSDRNLENIYDKLAEKRSNPNRLDVVTSELLEEPDSTTTDDIFKDVKIVLDRISLKSTERINESDVLTLLRLNEKKKNRVDIVIRQLLVSLQEADGNENNAAGNSTRKEKDIFEEVQFVVSKFPELSPDEIYTLIEQHPPSCNRVQIVIDNLNKKNALNSINSDAKTKLERLESDPDNPLTKNDPIYQDMRVISKMFPERDRNEIYAYLEAYHNKPDRIQVVIEELLRFENDSQDGGTVKKLSVNPLTNRSLSEFENLCEIFPDCDPNYIFEELEANASDTDRMNKLAGRMFEKRDYPKLKDVLEKQQKTINKRKYQNMVLDIDDFLRKFPDPVTSFDRNVKAMSAGYKEHVKVQLKNDFRQLKDGYIKKVLENNDHYYFKCLDEINTEVYNLAQEGRHSKKLREIDRGYELPYPEIPDEFFFNELLYSKHEMEIKMHLVKLDNAKKLRIKQARENGELYECGCCYDDEVLFEDMATCADGHLFCKVCIRRSTEAAIGDAKVKFPCLTGTCEHDIPLSVLQTVVPANMFSNILRKLQEEELRLADIPDLVACPYCSFATVMPDPNDKVFKCLNPECLKETCRHCKEANHIPLKCNEVEKKTETDMRTFIETKISESMLRTCQTCNKRFFKDFGCNKMTCTCGATMCYVCREPNIDYDHFNDNGGCANDNDVNALHHREMANAAEAAKQQYIQEHPELAGLELKYDPSKLVDNMNAGPVKRRPDNYDDGEDGWDEDEDVYSEDGYES